MKYGKALRILLQSILIAAFLIGIALLSIYLIKSFVRKSVSNGAQNAVKSAISNGGGDVTYDVPDSDFFSVDGELGEDDISPSDLVSFKTNLMDLVTKEMSQEVFIVRENTIRSL